MKSIKRALLSLILSFLFSIVIGQDVLPESGIRFEKELTWPQLLEKAKKENKYIFIDCYTTWCGPCKIMDREIYTQKLAGTTYNQHFISVKVQMDRAKDDNESIKSWYKDADSIKLKNQVTAYPSYLFFTPSGELAYKDLGVKDISSFIALAEKARNPKEQVNIQINNWRQGIRDYSTMLKFHQLMARTGNKLLADSSAAEYKAYLNKVPENEVLAKENSTFLFYNTQLIKSNDPVFKVFVQHAQKTNDSRATGIVNQVIIAEEIRNKIFDDKQNPKLTNPDWKTYQQNISKKYTTIDAQKIILEEKKSFYKKVKKWDLFVKTIDEYIGIYKGTLTKNDAFGKLNSPAWDIFENSSVPQQLHRAIEWTDLAIQLDSNLQIPDTKANLLYKLGRVQEAISLEEDTYARFIKASNESMEKTGKGWRDPYFAATLEKMKKGEKTWPESQKTEKVK